MAISQWPESDRIDPGWAASMVTRNPCGKWHTASWRDRLPLILDGGHDMASRIAQFGRPPLLLLPALFLVVSVFGVAGRAVPTHAQSVTAVRVLTSGGTRYLADP